MDITDSGEWRLGVFMALIPRVTDYRNYDFIKKKMQSNEHLKQVYIRFGILNLFNVTRPNGSYRLDLAISEERQVCKLLLELAKAEGYSQMTAVTLSGKPVESVNKEFYDKLPTEGVFEGTYVCAEENVKGDVREALGKKYLDWEA